MFEKACDDGYSQSCNNLGNLYSKGQSVKQDHLKAAKLWQKACDDEIGQSCSNLGVLYLKGQGIKHDYIKAIKLFKKACDLGYQRICDYFKKMNNSNIDIIRIN